MNIRICKNIQKFRKDQEVTQAQLANYLGVSPQAVSKWEQEAAMPDVYLIPKIAFFFDVSIDTLFGTSNMESTKLAVTKYSLVRNDKNYREAKEALENILSMNDQDLEALGMMVHLEYQRSLEYIDSSQRVCQKLLDLAQGKDEDWARKARYQMMRHDSMLGQFDFIDRYMKAFEANKTREAFNDLMIALLERHDYEEVIRWGRDYIESFDDDDQATIYPNLMEAALKLCDLEYGRVCFQKILDLSEQTGQVFNAWWLMWKLYKKAGEAQEAEACRQELIKQMPDQNFNDYNYEYFMNSLEGGSDSLRHLS